MLTDIIYEHLKDVYSTKVRSFISKPTIIDPNDTVSQVISKISKNNSYDAFYLNGKSILSTNTRDLLNAKNITTMKIGPFLYPIPYLDKNNTIQKAANIMAHYRIRSVPVVENQKIIGEITAKKIIQLLAKKDNKWIKANLIYTQKPITVHSDESLSTARKIMISKKIDHLPVENKGKIRQVLTSYHLLQTIIPKEGIGKKSIGVKPIRTLESRIGNIGSTHIPQCSPNDNLNIVINSILKNDVTCCLVNLWNNLQGIITYRDILSLLAAQIESPIPLYIVGLPDDQRNIDLITTKLERTLKKLQKVYDEIQEAKVSVKQQRTGRRKEGKFEVSIMITIPHHSPLIYTAIDFDLSHAIEELDQKLLKNLSKRAKRRSKFSVRKIGLPVSP